MVESHKRTDVTTLLAELKECSSSRDLQRGKMIHAQATRTGDVSHTYVANTLVSMYAKCGSMVDARQVFESMSQPSVVTWNALLLGYAENGEGELALQLFSCMRKGGFVPNTRTFVAALKACAIVAMKEQGNLVDGKLMKVISLAKGKDIHSQASKYDCDSSTFVANSLVSMYLKCGSLAEAQCVFDATKERSVVSWNILIMGYAENGKEELALDLLSCMQAEGLAPNARTFVALLQACSKMALKEEGKLVKMRLLKRGLLIQAEAARSKCESDMYVASGLVDMFSKCGSMNSARGVFESMDHPDLVAFTALIWGYAEAGEGKMALEILSCMKKKGLTPDAQTFVAALKACGTTVALQAGKKIHTDICRLGLEANPLVASSLVDFYGKCGSMVDAQHAFDSIVKKDLVAWNSLIASYGHQGNTERVFYMFDKLREEGGLRASGVTFLCVLAACAHAGLVQQGRECFEAMQLKHKLDPALEHYHCMLDILGRANQLEEAMAMMRSMPHRANAVTWTTLLDACRRWRNARLGKLAFEALVKLEEQQDVHSALVLMAGTYETTTTTMVPPSPPGGGCWWLDGAGVTHSFSRTLAENG